MQDQPSDCSQGSCCPLAGGFKGWLVWGVFLLLVVGYVVFSHNRSAANVTPSGVTGDVHASPAPANAEFQWADDLKIALAQAKTAKKPLFVKFGANWCPPCLYMDREVLHHKDVTAALTNTNMIAVKVDLDKHRDQAMQYGVRTIPVLMVLSSDGTVLARMDGALPPQQLVQFINAACKRQS